MSRMHSLLSTMAPFGRLPSIWVCLILSFFPYQTIAQGKVALFLDFDCKTPSTLAPTVSLPLSTCLVPVGAVSIAVDLLPACDSGAAQMIMYEDTSCARSFSNSGSYTGWNDIPNCFYLYISESIPGIMFTCDDPASDPQPTATSSVTASLVAGVATNSAGGSHATTASTANAAGTTRQGTGSTTSTTSSPAAGSTGTGGDSSGSASSKGSSGLSTSDKIAVGVGLGVGVPSVVIAFAAWCWPRHRF